MHQAWFWLSVSAACERHTVVVQDHMHATSGGSCSARVYTGHSCSAVSSHSYASICTTWVTLLRHSSWVIVLLLIGAWVLQQLCCSLERVFITGALGHSGLSGYLQGFVRNWGFSSTCCASICTCLTKLVYIKETDKGFLLFRDPSYSSCSSDHLPELVAIQSSVMRNYLCKWPKGDVVLVGAADKQQVREVNQSELKVNRC